MSDSEIINLIRSDEHSTALDRLYENFPAFKNKFHQMGGNRADADDVFQDALLILLKKVMDDSFSLNCNLNTFLFGICRNLSHEYFRKQGKEVKIDFLDNGSQNDIEAIEEYIEKEMKYKALDKILIKIGKKCIEILNLFYFQGLSMSSISQKLGFKSETSAKTQKYKCIEKARKLTENVLLETKTELV